MRIAENIPTQQPKIENPFEPILNELKEIKKLISNPQSTETIPEIIDRKELMKRLDISEPTAMKLVKKKKIPQINLGSAVRYDWKKVLNALNK